MDGNRTKLKVMVCMALLMLCYFPIMNFLNRINDKNENNSYVSLNLIFMTKEEYITEYIQNIQNEKYSLAYNMLSDETKASFSNSVDKFRAYAKGRYKGVSEKSWKFKFNIISENSYKLMNVYEYEVLDENKQDKQLIDTIKLNEYAINVFRISLV